MQSQSKRIRTRLLLLGRRLPPSLLWLLLWPSSAWEAAIELVRKSRDYGIYARLPLVPRPGGSHHAFFWPMLWLQQSCARAVRALDRWPDLYGSPRWRRRFFLTGSGEAISLLLANDRPLILYTFHTGPLEISPGLLRSYRIPMAGLWAFRADPTAERRAIEQAADEVNGLHGVPARFHPSQIRQVITFLQARNGVLATPGSQPGDNCLFVEADGVGADLATGLLRLAGLAGADVVPMVMQAGSWGTFKMHLGLPVPLSRVSDAANHPAICGEFLRFFVSIARASPGQIHRAFAEAIVRASDRCAATDERT